MRKKVAVLLPWLKMGGTNKVALRFIKQLIAYCDVTLILSQNKGELFDEVPSGVTVIIDKMQDFKDIFKDDLRGFRLRYLIKDLIYYAKIKFGQDDIDNYRYLVERHSFVSEDEFDCAITYHGQSPERLLNLIYRIHAKKKVAWIHGEMSFSQKTCDKMSKYYKTLDHFFFVSNPTMMSFQKMIGVEAGKCTVYYNPIDKTEILYLAEQPMDVVFRKDQYNLLTVGRISSEKDQDMIPQIVSKLLNQGLDVCWYIVGEGDNRKTVEELIEKFKVQDHVRLLGTKINPYSYMKHCDLYVQPSYTEGYSTTICEAGILGKAIIGTKPSGGIRDQITDGKDGLIVDATVNGLTEAVKYLLKNESLRVQFANRILNKNFEGNGEIMKFLLYLESDE